MIEIFERAALAAGRAILEVYEQGPGVSLKEDRSPVTEADQRAEDIILDMLCRALPDIPVVAEEAVAAGRIPAIDGRSFILVDPLDGTKEFIGRRREFTVNIALIEDGAPVVGVVYAPALGVAYVGSGRCAERLAICRDFTAARRDPIAIRPRRSPAVAVASRSHGNAETERFLREQGIEECRSIGSSLKFCLVAAGEADVYPRYGRTMEWDTAAGDAVLRAAGGSTRCCDGSLLAYGKTNQSHDADFANPHFIAWAR